MIFNYWREERSGGVPVVQLSLLSPLQNICPSNMATAPLSPREVACPIQDGQVCAGPGLSVIKRPSCAVTFGIEAGVIHDPVSAPLEEHAQTLTGQLRVKPRTEYLWRTTVSSPPHALAGSTSACWPTLLPKCRMGPHQACQSINRKEPHTFPPRCCVSFQRRLIHLERRTEFWQTFSRHWGHEKYIQYQPTSIIRKWSF